MKIVIKRSEWVTDANDFPRDEKLFSAGMVVNPLQGPQTSTYQLYAGPKSYNGLRDLHVGLEDTIDFGWFGSLSSIRAESGYWIQVNQNAALCFSDSEPTDPSIRYNLHEGNNLVSFPAHSTVDIGDALSNGLETVITGIIGEGVAASYINGYGWMGSLAAFEGGKGYWITTIEPIYLIYEISEFITLFTSSLVFN